MFYDIGRMVTRFLLLFALSGERTDIKSTPTGSEEGQMHKMPNFGWFPCQNQNEEKPQTLVSKNLGLSLFLFTKRSVPTWGDNVSCFRRRPGPDRSAP